MKKINYFFPPKTYFKEYLQFISKIIYYPLKKIIFQIEKISYILYINFQISNLSKIPETDNYDIFKKFIFLNFQKIIIQNIKNYIYLKHNLFFL
jgi:hypothetical protein